MKKILYILLSLTTYTLSNSTFYEKGLKLLEQNNTIEAIKFFQQASENNNAKAMYKLGLIHEKQNQLEEAIAWYKKAKCNGNIQAKYNLGVLSCKNKTYDFLNDFKEYAENSTKLVQYDLAVCFSQKGNKKEALKWFQTVANKGDAKAQYQVAIRLNEIDEKIKWLKKSAKNNYADAQFELGKIFFKNKKIKNAKQWLQKAKKNNSQKATVYLERIKELGL